MRVQPLRQPLHPVPGLDRLQGLDHHLVAGVLPGQDDVVPHGAHEDVVLLGDQRDLGPQHVQRQRGQLHPADGRPSRSAVR